MPVEGPCLALTMPLALAATLAGGPVPQAPTPPQLVVQVVPALGADVNVVCRAGCVCRGVREGGPLCTNLAL